ncbi:MAG: dihydrofolate reductase [Patescibacteria group bacterium]|nr:dihydrofolate reductase [Patescibacteria group bacterium]
MVSIIVVIGKNREIGCNNKLLWDIPEDMERFKRITTGHTVIMGDKTYESIGYPLPGRKNVVVTLDKNYKAEGCEVKYSLENVLNDAKEGSEEVFVIGGGQIYKQSLPYTDKLYLTIVDDAPQADTYFPDYSEFKKVLSEEKKEHNGIKYRFLELVK